MRGRSPTVREGLLLGGRTAKIRIQPKDLIPVLLRLLIPQPSLTVGLLLGAAIDLQPGELLLLTPQCDSRFFSTSTRSVLCSSPSHFHTSSSFRWCKFARHSNMRPLL